MGKGGAVGGFDDYALADGAAVGATGAVSWARHVPSGQAVAVTELSAAVAADEAFVGRVRSTAEALAKVGHPNVLPIREVVEGDGRVWVVEDWVDGRELGEVLGDGPLTSEQAVALTCGVLRGLEAVQKRWVVHGDISPSSIVVGSGGVPMLVGFGFAGLPGRPPADAATDVTAVAGVLLDLLAATTGSTRHRKVDAAVDQATSANEKRRPKDAAAFLAVLEKAARSDFGRDWVGRASLAGLATKAPGVVTTELITPPVEPDAATRVGWDDPAGEPAPDGTALDTRAVVDVDEADDADAPAEGDADGDGGEVATPAVAADAEPEPADADAADAAQADADAEPNPPTTTPTLAPTPPTTPRPTPSLNPPTTKPPTPPTPRPTPTPTNPTADAEPEPADDAQADAEPPAAAADDAQADAEPPAAAAAADDDAEAATEAPATAPAAAPDESVAGVDVPAEPTPVHATPAVPRAPKRPSPPRSNKGRRRTGPVPTAPTPAATRSPAPAPPAPATAPPTVPRRQPIRTWALAALIVVVLGAGIAVAVTRDRTGDEPGQVASGSGTTVLGPPAGFSDDVPVAERPTAAEIADSDVVGDWRMQLVVYESTGFFGTQVGQTVEKIYTIRSECSTSPCTLRLAVSGTDGEFELRDRGDEYFIAASGPQDCIDLPSGALRVANGGLASVTVQLRPNSASRTPRGDWVASGLSGSVVTTFDTSNPDCINGSGVQRSTALGSRQ